MLNQSGAERKPKLPEPFGSAEHAADYFLKASLLPLLDYLAVDQIRMGLLDRVLRPPLFSCTGKGLQGMVELDQSRQVGAQSITEKTWNPLDHRGGHPDELQSTLKGPWPYKGWPKQ